MLNTCTYIQFWKIATLSSVYRNDWSYAFFLKYRNWIFQIFPSWECCFQPFVLTNFLALQFLFKVLKNFSNVKRINKWTRGPWATSLTWENSSISINTYDYIITLIKRRKKNINLMRIYFFFIWRNFNPLHPRMICAKFGWNWLIGSGGKDFLIS